MSKDKECKVKGFEGHVLFHDPLNLEQVFAIEGAQEAANEIEPSKFLTQVNEVRGIKNDSGETVQAAWTSRTDRAFLDAIVLCVKEWHLAGVPEGVTKDTFPMSPRGRAHELIDWLWSALIDIYQGEVEVPNA